MFRITMVLSVLCTSLGLSEVVEDLVGLIGTAQEIFPSWDCRLLKKEEEKVVQQDFLIAWAEEQRGRR